MAKKLTKKTSQAVKPVKAVVKAKASMLNLPKKYVSAIGRRKSAVARVRLFEGKQEMLVNGQPISNYFNQPHFQDLYEAPLRLTNTFGKYSASIKVIGSGLLGQIGALTHGIARALIQVNPDLKPALRKNGFLTRDSRMKETRKVGQAGKARHKKQSPKR